MPWIKHPSLGARHVRQGEVLNHTTINWQWRLWGSTFELSPTRNFKWKVFIWKTYVISSHTALHFIYVLTLSEISKNSSFNRSKVFLDRSKYSTNLFWSFWMTQSTLDSCSIDQKTNPINQKEFSIDRKIEEIHHKVSG